VKRPTDRILTEGEERARAVLAHTFGGIHHVPFWNRRRPWGRGVVVSVDSGIATFDGSTLTRLVVAAHDHCVRVTIMAGGPQMLKIGLTPRKREGDVYDGHPTMEVALVRARMAL
jgi:hypothetical protein